MTLLPSSRLIPCSACGELLRAGSGRCPHCDASLSEGTGLLCTAALLVSGLTLTGCLVTAVYGVPATESDSFQPPLSTGSGTETDTSTSTGTTTGETTGAPTTGTPTTSTSTGTTTTDETTGTTTDEPETGTASTGTDTGATTSTSGRN
ncbi:hypothetical protein OV203_41510 [Nannocystis sp. ILAH1]|uniref:hypothetical protein n=1 Tax=Nannocystis sp. ILAH1 TaxID=2996789 RepID=UPI00226F5857|nr:hypothetical protein [Nannocystis sp. ILAH1]MCY0993689.1 hypothetical protein [Nannocystis sp. ILAH1]